jgi:hypothetical protein
MSAAVVVHDAIGRMTFVLWEGALDFHFKISGFRDRAIPHLESSTKPAARAGQELATVLGRSTGIISGCAMPGVAAIEASVVDLRLTTDEDHRGQDELPCSHQGYRLLGRTPVAALCEALELPFDAVSPLATPLQTTAPEVAGEAA